MLQGLQSATKASGRACHAMNVVHRQGYAGCQRYGPMALLPRNVGKSSVAAVMVSVNECEAVVKHTSGCMGPWNRLFAEIPTYVSYLPGGLLVICHSTGHDWVACLLYSLLNIVIVEYRASGAAETAMGNRAMASIHRIMRAAVLCIIATAIDARPLAYAFR